MTSQRLSLALAIGALMTLPVLAQDSADPPERGPRNSEWRQRALEEFDTDKDGKLSDEERQKMRETMRERFGERGPRNREGRPEGRGPEGRRGPGQGGRMGEGPHRGPEGRGGPPVRPEILFTMFDANEDGQLNREEFRALAGAMHRLASRGHGEMRRGPDQMRRGPRGPEDRRGPRPDRPGRPDGPPPTSEGLPPVDQPAEEPV